MLRFSALSGLMFAVATMPALADVSKETIESLSAPESIDTRIGTLEFNKGVPSDATARNIFDTMDFTRAVNAYNNSFRGASALGLKKGFQSVGAESGDIVIFRNSWVRTRCS